jgi:hypothetical protein
VNRPVPWRPSKSLQARKFLALPSGLGGTERNVLGSRVVAHVLPSRCRRRWPSSPPRESYKRPCGRTCWRRCSERAPSSRLFTDRSRWGRPALWTPFCRTS